MDGGDAVSNTLYPQNLNCLANLLRPANFPRMHQPVKPMLRRPFINAAKFSRGQTQFISSNPKRHNPQRSAPPLAPPASPPPLQIAAPHQISNSAAIPVFQTARSLAQSPQNSLPAAAA